MEKWRGIWSERWLLQKNGEYVNIILNSPNDPEFYTIQKEHQHKIRENFKTLYESFEDSDGNQPQITANELPPAIVKYINTGFI